MKINQFYSILIPGEIVLLEQVPVIAGASASDKQGTYDIYLQIVN